MFCRNCGKELNETQKFCPYCGQKAGEETAYSSPNGYPQTAAVANQRKSKTGLIVGIVAAVIVLIVAIGIFIAGNSEKETLSFNLSVVNDTGVDIYALYASQPEVDDWEEDILVDEVLCDGDTIDVEFTVTEDTLDWDFAIEDIEGNIIEFYGLSFEDCSIDGANLILEYDGEDGYATLY